jgi:hypothetical protein
MLILLHLKMEADPNPKTSKISLKFWIVSKIVVLFWDYFFFI